MSTPLDKKQNQTKTSSQWAGMVGLALSVSVELTAGPFLGYVLGGYLVRRQAWPDLTVIILVFIGFLMGLYAVARTISRISAIDRNNSHS